MVRPPTLFSSDAAIVVAPGATAAGKSLAEIDGLPATELGVLEQKPTG